MSCNMTGLYYTGTVIYQNSTIHSGFVPFKTLSNGMHAEAFRDDLD